MTQEQYKNILAFLAKTIKGTRFEGHLYSVGGCERDALAGREIKDIDLVLDILNGGIEFANWLYTEGLLCYAPVTYEHFGTAMFHLKEFPDLELEAVQTRKEAYHDMESRNPDTAFGTIQDDCTRRDFTYNAIYHNISTDEICDFNGRSLEDHKDNILRTCGDPEIIFTEDPLRILRAIRFASRFGSVIEPHTYKGMEKFVDRLSIISKERIAAEFDKMLTCKNVDYALRTIWEIGAMKYIVPELSDIEKTEKRTIYKRLTFAYPYDYITKMAILLYDIKDPEKALRELKYSNDIINEVMFVINTGNAMLSRPFNVYWYYESLRELQYKCKTPERFARVSRANYAYFWGAGGYEYGVLETGLMMDSNRLIQEGTDMFGYKLPVTGNDVMEHLGIEPGKKVKEVLDMLMKAAYKNPLITREQCFDLM